ncbi:hypothetical protein BCR33DRAFT_765117 [Rhizoclosmatium globosum]|uniref:Uncharacterized protein n=1 Tax=Rhizoclosmatium globosum TaxID=329046 RepID=A0A1Y2CFM4_9FUNG|nr:hypothetical protein BCR33DRAFT_765117 [Rhizoclosmatium globosum]|eukprot:ORY45868.1 hypothetical protein BCR33DRAFT_765117 [Rhizoclosmatium globosum]
MLKLKVQSVMDPHGNQPYHHHQQQPEKAVHAEAGRKSSHTFFKSLFGRKHASATPTTELTTTPISITKTPTRSDNHSIPLPPPTPPLSDKDSASSSSSSHKTADEDVDEDTLPLGRLLETRSQESFRQFDSLGRKQVRFSRNRTPLLERHVGEVFGGRPVRKSSLRRGSDFGLVEVSGVGQNLEWVSVKARVWNVGSDVGVMVGGVGEEDEREAKFVCIQVSRVAASFRDIWFSLEAQAKVAFGSPRIRVGRVLVQSRDRRAWVELGVHDEVEWRLRVAQVRMGEEMNLFLHVF